MMGRTLTPHGRKSQGQVTPCVETGWRLGFGHWRNGYATEAARFELFLSRTLVTAPLAAKLLKVTPEPVDLMLWVEHRICGIAVPGIASNPSDGACAINWRDVGSWRYLPFGQGAQSSYLTC